MQYLLALSLAFSPLTAAAEDWDPLLHGFPGLSPRQVEELLGAAQAGAFDYLLPPGASGARAALLQHPEACLKAVVEDKLGLSVPEPAVPPKVLYATRMSAIEFTAFQVDAAKAFGQTPPDVFDFYAQDSNTLYLNDRPGHLKGGASLDGAYVRLYALYLRGRRPRPAGMTRDQVELEAQALRAWFDETFVVGKADPCAWAASAQK